MALPNPFVHGLTRSFVGRRVLARVLDRQQRCPKDLDAFGVGLINHLLAGGDELFRLNLFVADVIDAFEQNQVRHVRS